MVIVIYPLTVDVVMVHNSGPGRTLLRSKSVVNFISFVGHLVIEVHQLAVQCGNLGPGKN